MFKGGLAVIALVVALFVGAGCGGSSDESTAHINEDSGMTHDLAADDREGIPPKPPKETDLEKLASRAGCYLFLELDEDARSEVREGFTEPATYGDHPQPPQQQADGAYLEMPVERDVLASLDHGRLAIQYAPDLSEQIQRELKGLYETMYGATLLFPNNTMNYAIVATAWTNFLGCTTWENQETIDVLRAFGKETWGKYGQEPVEDFPFEGPTPAEPEESGAAE